MRKPSDCGVPPSSPRAVGAGQTGKTITVLAHVPHPARNLGVHMKPPKGGEYVTNHHRTARKPR